MSFTLLMRMVIRPFPMTMEVNYINYMKTCIVKMGKNYFLKSTCDIMSVIKRRNGGSSSNG